MRPLTIDDVSGEYGIPMGTLRHWRTNSTGPKSFKIGRRVVYRREDIDSWIQEQYDKATR